MGVSWRRGLLVLSVRLPVFFDFAVLDLETTGLSPGVDEVVGFGWVEGDRLLGVVRSPRVPESRVRGWARMLVRSALSRGLVVYAWFKDFEESFLRVTGLSELQVESFEKKDLSLSWGLAPPARGKDVPRLWHSGDYEAVLMRAVYDALIEAASVLRLELKQIFSQARRNPRLKTRRWEK